VNYEKMSREELISVLVSGLAACSSEGSRADDATRLLHDLQVRQVELEAQNCELHEARAELEESLERYTDLYDSAPLAYFSLDESGVVRDLNVYAARFLGHERGRVVGHPLLQFLTLKPLSALWSHLGKCAASREPETAELSLQVGERSYDVEMISLVKPACEGAPHGDTFRSALVDVTGRRRTEAELQRLCASEQGLRARIEAVDRAHCAVSAVLAAKDSGLQDVVDAILHEAIDLTEARYAELQFVDGVDYGPQAARRFSAGVATDLPRTHWSSTLAFAGKNLAVLSVYREHGAELGEHEAKCRLDMFAERVASSLEVSRCQLLERRERDRLSLAPEAMRPLPTPRPTGACSR